MLTVLALYCFPKEEQGPFSQVLLLVGARDGTTTFLTTGLCFPPASCIDGGKGTSSLPLSPQGRWVRGTAVPCSGFRSWLTHTCAKGLALLCHFVEVQGLPSGVLQWVGVGCQRLLSPSVPPQNRWVMGTVLPCSQIQDWLTHSSANRVASDTPPCWVHSLLSQRLLLMGEGVVRNSSPTLMTTGPAYSPVPGIDELRGATLL